MKPLDTVTVGPPVGNYRPVIAMAQAAKPQALDTYAGVHYEKGDTIVTTWHPRPLLLMDAVDRAREAAALAAQRTLHPIPEDRAV